MRQLSLCAALGLLQLLHCAKPPLESLLVTVNVQGLTSEVKSLGVTLRLDGKLAKEGDILITDDLRRFAFRVPPEGGALSLTIGGLDGSGLARSGATAELTLAADVPAASLDVTLQPDVGLAGVSEAGPGIERHPHRLARPAPVR